MHSPYWITERKPHWNTRKSEYTPERLWELAVEYFTFCQAEPLKEEKIVSADGAPMKVELNKMRAMTIEGLCAHIGIGKRTWHQWASGDRKREDLAEVIDRIKTIMEAQKLEGAAAGLLNATIISRICGLSDKTEITGKDGAELLPPPDPAEIARKLAFALAAGVKAKD